MGTETGVIWVLLIIAALLYLIPTYCAASRGHNNTAPIFLTNLIFGWTGIGWIVALIWAFTDNVRKKA